ncbi:hypothetical protein KSD_82480 [Ktedonobacter sp. SOSP1-85]|nr:hypothetical protein KSD_82480 [Ktedonobacter sp. SOSP1-85]
MGGHKEAINVYLDACQEENGKRYARLEIKPSYNRMPELITVMITIPEEPATFPWIQPVEEEQPAFVFFLVYCSPKVRPYVKGTNL